MSKRLEQECLDAYNNLELEYKLTDRVPDAIWGFPIVLPPKPEHPELIANYGLPKEERKFPLYKKSKIEAIEALYNAEDDYTRQKYLDFVEEEVRRRFEGFWFYNGDCLEYITGWHYVFLQYWYMSVINPASGRIDELRPNFRDAHRDTFLVIDYIKSRGIKTAGLIWLSYRRFGKSAISTFVGFMDTTENNKSRFAIQSKNEKDAVEQFKDMIIAPWKKLPIFFKPLDDGSTTHTNNIYFGHAKKKGVKIEDREYDEVLDSLIYTVNSKEAAIDGKYATFFLRDEAAKAEKAIDVEEGWNVTRETLFIGNKRIGIGIITSTAEDMEKFGSRHFYNMWKNSDPSNRLPNGYTHSYLYPFFIPAYYGFTDDDEDESEDRVRFMDDWGYSNVEACKQYHQDYYKALSGKNLLSRKRKYPCNFNDAWVMDDMRNTFPTMKLIQQKIHNDVSAKHVVQEGNFEWEGGIRDTRVVWRPLEGGRWLVGELPHEHDRNMFDMRGTQRFPTREYCYTGVDPFSHAATVDHGSMGAIITVMKNSPFNPAMKEGVVCMYKYRQSDPNLLAEDAIMQAVFYSSMIFPERNTYGFIQQITARGYAGYLYKDLFEPDLRKRQKGDYGFPNNEPNKREALVSVFSSWMMDRLGEQPDGSFGFCPFNALIQDCLDFELQKWTKYDIVVAAMLAIGAMRASKTTMKTTFGNPEDWFVKLPQKTAYDIHNMQARLLGE